MIEYDVSVNSVNGVLDDLFNEDCQPEHIELTEEIHDSLDKAKVNAKLSHCG